MRNDGSLIISGLKDADVTIRLTEPFAHVLGEVDSEWPRMEKAFELKYSDDGLFAVAEDITGELTIYTQSHKNRDEYTRLGYFDYK